MASKRRCSLCGERLDSSLRCTVCGLDNSKNDDMYKHLLNQNDCADQPLTHVHAHEEPKKYTYAQKTNYSSKKPTGRKAEKGKKKVNPVGCIIVLVFGMMLLFTTIIPVVTAIIGSLVTEFQEEALPEYEYTPEADYQDGYWLSPGIQEAGVHIPVGKCDVILEYGEWVNLSVYERSHYENVFQQKGSVVLYVGEMCSLELEEGDYLVVEAVDDVFDTSVWLYSSSYDFTESMYVDSTEMYSISGEVTTGVDFPAGVYDIIFVPEEDWGYGEVQIMIASRTQEKSAWVTALSFECLQDDFDYAEDNAYGYYTNIPLTPGSIVTVGEELLGEVYLAPSYEVGVETYDMTWGATEE